MVTTIGRATVRAGARGVDFSFAKPPAQRLLELGYTFVVGYISVPPASPAKNISKSQCEAYIAAGLKVLLVWEMSATSAGQGAPAGATHGRDAKRLASDRGYPTDVPILCADDTNTVATNIDAHEAYVRAFAAACAPYPIGIYGDTDILTRCAGLWRIGWVPNAWSWSGGSRKDSEAKARALGAHVLQRTGFHIDNTWAVDPNDAIADFPAWGTTTPSDHLEQPPVVVNPPTGEPMKPYLFKLADGGVGVRDTTGTRPLNTGEVEGPFAGETVWAVPAGSNWEAWIRLELARYERELNPAVSVSAGSAIFPVGTITMSGTITPG